MIENTTVRLSPGSRPRSAAAALVAFACAMAAAGADAAIALDPLLPGQYAAGTGANAVFHRIDGNWTGTAVYWSEDEQRYSNTAGSGFTRIGELGWGTGIWGLADWRAINAPGSTLPVQSWSDVVATIDQGDAQYAADPNGAATWGAAAPLPATLFAVPGVPQDNWTSHYTGYLRITDPGAYNFGVLYDDGFFLRIWGAGAAPLEISSDFLSARDRLGFDDDLALGTGLYRFELGAYERLEVGVVNLGWRQGDGEWQTVPTEHLVTTPVPALRAPGQPVPVSAPGTVGALLAGIAAFAATRTRKRP
ncbi:MAG TPA: PEP-CTERM sorting domain-containing protein [Quisquiliibacterium sp.]|nr:PEP-CTERM sorting domain-containing protein [Quisquiliibacterium sp.]